jgi:hypothetical protein
MVSDTQQPAISPVTPKNEHHKTGANIKRKFFANGITGVNDLIWRFENRKDLVGDYNGALSYDKLLIQHLSMLNQRYGWGFAKVDADTALWILRKSEEVYEPFGYGEYTIFGFDKNGWMVPMTRGSYGAEKLIKFHNVAITSCYCGNLVMPAQPVQSWPARIKPAPAHDCKCNQSCGWWNGLWNPWWLFPILLVLALIAFIIWLFRDRHMTHGHNHNHQHEHVHRWVPRPPADTSNHTMD